MNRFYLILILELFSLNAIASGQLPLKSGILYKKFNNSGNLPWQDFVKSGWIGEAYESSGTVFSLADYPTDDSSCTVLMGFFVPAYTGTYVLIQYPYVSTAVAAIWWGDNAFTDYTNVNDVSGPAGRGYQISGDYNFLFSATAGVPQAFIFSTHTVNSYDIGFDILDPSNVLVTEFYINYEDAVSSVTIGPSSSSYVSSSSLASSTSGSTLSAAPSSTVSSTAISTSLPSSSVSAAEPLPTEVPQQCDLNLDLASGVYVKLFRGFSATGIKDWLTSGYASTSVNGQGYVSSIDTYGTSASDSYMFIGYFRAQTSGTHVLQQSSEDATAVWWGENAYACGTDPKSVLPDASSPYDYGGPTDFTPNVLVKRDTIEVSALELQIGEVVPFIFHTKLAATFSTIKFFGPDGVELAPQFGSPAVVSNSSSGASSTSPVSTTFTHTPALTNSSTTSFTHTSTSDNSSSSPSSTSSLSTATIEVPSTCAPPPSFSTGVRYETYCSDSNSTDMSEQVMSAGKGMTATDSGLLIDILEYDLYPGCVINMVGYFVPTVSGEYTLVQSASDNTAVWWGDQDAFDCGTDLSKVKQPAGGAYDYRGPVVNGGSYIPVSAIYVEANAVVPFFISTASTNYYPNVEFLLSGNVRVDKYFIGLSPFTSPETTSSSSASSADVSSFLNFSSSSFAVAPTSNSSLSLMTSASSMPFNTSSSIFLGVTSAASSAASSSASTGVSSSVYSSAVLNISSGITSAASSSASTGVSSSVYSSAVSSISSGISSDVSSNASSSKSFDTLESGLSRVSGISTSILDTSGAESSTVGPSLTSSTPSTRTGHSIPLTDSFQSFLPSTPFAFTNTSSLSITASASLSASALGISSTTTETSTTGLGSVTSQILETSSDRSRSSTVITSASTAFVSPSTIPQNPSTCNEPPLLQSGLHYNIFCGPDANTKEWVTGGFEKSEPQEYGNIGTSTFPSLSSGCSLEIVGYFKPSISGIFTLVDFGDLTATWWGSNAFSCGADLDSVRPDGLLDYGGTQSSKRADSAVSIIEVTAGEVVPFVISTYAASGIPTIELIGPDGNKVTDFYIEKVALSSSSSSVLPSQSFSTQLYTMTSGTLTIVETNAITVCPECTEATASATASSLTPVTPISSVVTVINGVTVTIPCTTTPENLFSYTTIVVDSKTMTAPYPSEPAATAESVPADYTVVVIDGKTVTVSCASSDAAYSGVALSKSTGSIASTDYTVTVTNGAMIAGTTSVDIATATSSEQHSSQEVARGSAVMIKPTVMSLFMVLTGILLL